jgi:beta-lactamase regulating signal transducer with metallopeptidase domain
MIDAILAITLAWIATYLIHSTVLLGGTWLIARFGRVGEPAQELLWKLALIGGVITATGQFVTRIYHPAPRVVALKVPVHATPADNRSPVTALWNRLHAIPEQSARRDAHDAAASISPENLRRAFMNDATPADRNPGATFAPNAPTFPLAMAADQPNRSGETRDIARNVDAAEPAAAAASDDDTRTRTAGMPMWWRGIGAATVIFGGAVWTIGLVTFRRRIRRRPCTNQAWIEVLDHQRAAFGYTRNVRLTVSDDIVVPMAMGILRPEVCLPVDADRTLPGCEFRAAMAHELAHLHRRDPIWLLVYRAVQMLLFVQPLNRFAVRRLIELSEYQCDAWAAETTRDPLALARCLERVARRLVLGDTDQAILAHAPVASLAMKRSMLGRRVGRLLQPARPLVRQTAQMRLALIVASSMLVAVTMHVPGVQASMSVIPAGNARSLVLPDASPLPAPLAAPTDLSIVEDAVGREDRVDVGDIDDARAMREALQNELAELEADLSTLTDEWNAVRERLVDHDNAEIIRARLEGALENLSHRYATIRGFVQRVFEATDIPSPTPSVREN